MSFTFYLALTLTNIRNQVARPTSRVSVPASQLAKQPASRQAGQNLSQLKAQPASQPANEAAGRAKEEKKFFFRFFPFFAGKRYAETKKHTCVRAEKEKKIFFRFFPFFAGKRYAEKKSATHAFGQRKKKKIDFSFFPALSAKGVHRTKTTLLIQHRFVKAGDAVVRCFHLKAPTLPSSNWVLEHNPFALLLNVSQILRNRVRLKFGEISDWPIVFFY